MKQKKGFITSLDERLGWDKKNIGLFFLGIGLIMFILNITTMLEIIIRYDITIPMSGYYVSILSSVFLMAYSLYNIYSK